MLRAQSILLALCLTVLPASIGFAQAKFEPAPDFPFETIHYYDGNRVVELLVALDELAVSDAQDRLLNPAGVAAATRGQSVEEEDDGRTAIVRYAIPSADAADLTLRAGALAQSGLRAAAIAYAPVDVDRDAEVRRRITKRIALKLNEDVEIEDLVAAYELTVIQKFDFAAETYLCEVDAPGLLAGVQAANAIFESGQVDFATPEIVRQRALRLVPNDPDYSDQWHLNNTGQASGSHVSGNDVNINGAWNSATGDGVNIAIADEGVEVAHPDLAANVRTDIDLDINGGDNDPTPSSGQQHGTNCAGIAAAVGNNSLGVTGAAFDAGIVGIRLIASPTTDSDEATAMGHQVSPASANDRVHINSNSWGPTDDANRKETWGPLTLAAVQNGILNGRGGLGTIYVWAAGNGRSSNDNINYDGYASSRFTIAVGASGGDGNWSYYSEPGASMLVNTPSSDSFSGTTTTQGSSGYTSSFGGTSSAAPLAAGIIALLLETNPNLSWRDVQHILVDTADKIDAGDGGWFANGSGRDFNHAYGYGRMNAGVSRSAAAGWLGVPDSATPLSDFESISVAIPDNSATGVTRSFNFNSAPEGFFVEAVEVAFSATHTYRGDLEIQLTSPQGTVSVLAEEHGDSGNDYSNWVFTSMAHWGEDPTGTWSLKVADRASPDAGTWTDWALIIRGFQVDLANVYADFAHSGFEVGTENRPLSTLADALDLVGSGGTVHLNAGSTSDTPTINQAVTLESNGGTVTLGG